MSSRAIARLLFVVITVLLCAVVFLQSQALSAHAEAAGGPQDELGEGVNARTPTIAGPAPQPLRWYVDFALKKSSDTYDTYCVTSVIGRNLSPSELTFQVEWLDDTGSLGYNECLIPAGRTRTVTTGFTPLSYPFLWGVYSDLTEFTGNANVHADDPRVHVSAYIVCRDAPATTGKIVGMTTVGVSPVGASAEYFQAGIPASSEMPRVTVPEAPEAPQAP